MAAVVNSQPAPRGGPGSSTVRVRPKERACLKVTASLNRELQAHVSIKRTQAAVPSRADHCGVILPSTCSPPRAAKQVDRCATRDLFSPRPCTRSNGCPLEHPSRCTPTWVRHGGRHCQRRSSSKSRSRSPAGQTDLQTRSLCVRTRRL